jgi:hypothetical protein
MPESLTLPVTWDSEEAFLAGLSRRTRRLLREEVLPHAKDLRVEVLQSGIRKPTAAELAHFHTLCDNVRRRNLGLNTFALPAGIFERMLESPNWELVVMHRADAPEGALPVGVSASFKGPGTYVPMVVGLDYDMVASHGLYRRFLLEAVRRGKVHGAEEIYFGMGAPLEKQRLGAQTVTRCVYIQASDHYHEELMAQISRK